MATEEDIKSKTDDELPEEEGSSETDAPADDSSSAEDASLSHSDEPSQQEEADAAAEEEFAPNQLGTKRFVYAAYFAGAIGIAFFLSKVGSFTWAKLSLWRPNI